MYDATTLKNLMLNDNGFGFDPTTGLTYNLSLSAIAIVRLLNDNATEDEVLAFLTDTYDVEQQRAIKDLDAFFATLCHYGLLAPETEQEQA